MTARPRRVVYVECEWHLLSHVTALWCDDCKLPSAHEARYALTYLADPSRIIQRIVIRVCGDCGATIPGK